MAHASLYPLHTVQEKQRPGKYDQGSRVRLQLDTEIRKVDFTTDIVIVQIDHRSEVTPRERMRCATRIFAVGMRLQLVACRPSSVVDEI